MAPDPDAISSAAAGCPSVAALSPGTVGEIATFLPGRRVVGVRLTPSEVEVHVVARFGPSLPDVADDVRAAVVPLAEGLPVAVFIDDIETPNEQRERELGSAQDPRATA